MASQDADALEQRCLGRWRIEGLTVKRYGRAKQPLYWAISDGPRELSRHATLDLARGWIHAQRGASGAQDHQS